jgi:predicted  nucleic acid-binding Zn-ribbon protein
MAVTRQLFELQEVDDNIEATRRTLDTKKHALNNREALEKAAAALAAEQKTLDELKARRRSAEVESGDISAKINEANKQLYSGRISNPKELGNLQAEIKQMTAIKDGIETKTLAVIDLQEQIESRVNALTAEYQKMDANWATEQVQLAKDIELLATTLTALGTERLETAAKIDAASLSLYEGIRKKKKPAVAKVEQGICKGCRLSVSAAILQRARAGKAAPCGTCGRILFVV